MRLSELIKPFRRWQKAAPVLLSLLLFASQPSAAEQSAAFDLIGPKVEVRVQRAGVTLPIAEVPNLQAGDRLWLHADLPDSQSVHYLMVIAFLRGATDRKSVV